MYVNGFLIKLEKEEKPKVRIREREGNGPVAPQQPRHDVDGETDDDDKGRKR